MAPVSTAVGPVGCGPCRHSAVAGPVLSGRRPAGRSTGGTVATPSRRSAASTARGTGAVSGVLWSSRAGAGPVPSGRRVFTRRFSPRQAGSLATACLRGNRRNCTTTAGVAALTPRRRAVLPHRICTEQTVTFSRTVDIPNASGPRSNWPGMKGPTSPLSSPRPSVSTPRHRPPLGGADRIFARAPHLARLICTAHTARGGLSLGRATVRQQRAASSG